MHSKSYQLVGPEGHYLYISAPDLMRRLMQTRTKKDNTRLIQLLIDSECENLIRETIEIFENLICGGMTIIQNMGRELAKLLDISEAKALEILDACAEKNLATNDSQARPEEFNIPAWYWQAFNTLSGTTTSIYASKIINLRAMELLFLGLQMIELNQRSTSPSELSEERTGLLHSG